MDNCGKIAKIAFIFACLFIIAQIISIIDFSHSWNEDWVNRDWLASVLSFIIILSIASIVILLYSYVNIFKKNVFII